MKNNQLIFKYCLYLLITCSLIDRQCFACGPGRSGGRRRHARKMTPLVFKQYSPNLNENTMIASGPPEGRITRNDPRYKDLVPNYNPDILFRDAEGTGASRLMTQRLKEKLDILSISVMNQWPGVRLRVLKGWDEHNFHALQSLHYEGRAVDLATSDRDRSKNGMLARLAVQAGFDWVYYESRYHIHASVKSEKAHSLRPEGCFLGTSLVQTKKRGVITMDRLEVGDEILAKGSQNKLEYSKVLMFLDLDAFATKLYYFIKTETDAVIAITESHLIYVANSPNDVPDVEFAAYVKEGMYVLVPEQTVISRTGDDLITNDIDQTVNSIEHKPIKDNGPFKLVRVVEIKSEMRVSAYAPLTNAGTMIVDGVVVSCYAHLNNQNLAHLGFLPVRIFDKLYTVYFKIRDNYLGKSERMDELSKSELSKSEEINQINKQPIKVDRRIVNSKLLHLFDRNHLNDTISTNKLQYDLHKSIRPQQGIHWYAYLLFYLSKLIVPMDYIYQ